MHLTPIEQYQRDLEREGFVPDAAQYRAIAKLQDLYQRLLDRHRARKGPLAVGARLTRWFGGGQPVEPVVGLYLWGGVGRGKTYLMDLFYEALPLEKKMRVHFHRFMRRVHTELTHLKGEKNPLDKVAAILADETVVICFDEFFVADIADAMILGNLLKALFDRGVTLVATSNLVPDDLYKDGLQRARFLPAIALLNRYTEVVNVDGDTDYRLRALRKAELFYTPLGERADKELEKCFARLTAGRESVREDVLLEIEGRQIHAVKEAEDVVWFEFEALCGGPRSQHDYIELAKEYQSVILANVPAMGAHNDDQARRFVYLVDEFYDRQVNLVMSAANTITELYSGGRLRFEFERTISRLLEMQSEEFLARAHKP